MGWVVYIYAGAATWDREATDLGGHAHAVFTIMRQAAEGTVQRQQQQEVGEVGQEEVRRGQTDGRARDDGEEGSGRTREDERREQQPQQQRTSLLPKAAMRAVAAAAAWVTA